MIPFFDHVPGTQRAVALNMLRHAIHYVWRRHDEEAAQILTRAFLQVLYGR
jgi:hypothetical protein